MLILSSCAVHVAQESSDVVDMGIYKSSEFSANEDDPRYSHLPLVDNLEAFLAARKDEGDTGHRENFANVDLQ